MAIRWAVANGDNNQTSTWNDGATLGLPTSADDVFTNGFTVNMVANATYVSMNNSARARTIATPQMTANNAPSPYVAAGSVANLGQPFQAFNRSYNTNADFWGGTSVSTGWVSIDFGSGSLTVIDGYTIFGTSTQASNPRNWSLQGSDDNTTWTNLHIVSGAAAIAASSTYSIASIGNTTGYRYYRLNITLNGGGANIGITELELYQPFTAAIAAGGSFNFNTSGVTVSVTSTSASLGVGAINLITVTATGGTVTLSLGSIVTGGGVGISQIFNHTGNSNFTLNGIRFVGGSVSNAFCINKSSTGTITITGDVAAGTSSSANGLNSTAGNTVVIGNTFSSSSAFAINQSAGNVTVTGNVIGGTGVNVVGINLTGPASQFTINGNVIGGSASNSSGISFNGTLGTVNGNVSGGTLGVGIATTNSIIINGNVIAGGTIGISSTSAIPITINGTVTASATAPAISMTNANGQVYLNGNMTNINGFQGVYASNLFLGSGTTTFAAFTTSGGADRTLYSPDTFPNLPSTTDVRQSIGFGPASGLTGTMIVASPSNVRVGVLTDNTVGTGSLTPEDFLNAISASTHPIAVRLKNVSTVETTGDQISSYNI